MQRQCLPGSVTGSPTPHAGPPYHLQSCLPAGIAPPGWQGPVDPKSVTIAPTGSVNLVWARESLQLSFVPCCEAPSAALHACRCLPRLGSAAWPCNDSLMSQHSLILLRPSPVPAAMQPPTRMVCTWCLRGSARRPTRTARTGRCGGSTAGTCMSISVQACLTGTPCPAPQPAVQQPHARAWQQSQGGG